MSVLGSPRRFRRPRRRAAPLTASRRALDRLKLFLDVSRLSAVGNVEVLLRRLGETAASLLAAERAQLYLYDARTSELWTRRPAGPQETVSVGQGFLAIVLASETAVRHDAAEHGPLGEPVRNALATPMRDIDLAPLGVLVVADKSEGDFTEEDAVVAELLAEQAAVAIQRFRVHAAAGQAAELRREMEVARALQAQLIPSVAPRLDDVETFGWMRSASLTGGDAFDIWTLPDERLGAFLGDASGHGLPAALVISQVRTLVRSLSEIQDEPEWLLARVNSRLAEDLPEGRFATAFVAMVARGGVVRWSSAGQGPVFVCRSPVSGYEALPAPSVPLGVSHELAAEPTSPVTLEPGGTMVVASDGILEARGEGQEMLGPARLLQVLEEGRSCDARELATRVRDRLDQWQQSSEPADDQTLLVIRRTELRSAARPGPPTAGA